MLFTSVLLLLLPFCFQLYMGNKAMKSTIILSFGKICLISFVLQLIITIIALFIAATAIADEGKLVCGMPLAGLIMISIIITFVMIIIMAIQYFVKRNY